MVYLELVNIDTEHRFIKTYDLPGAIKFLKKLLYSPHIRAIAYENESPYIDQDLEYWFARQVQYVLPILEYVKSFPLYHTGGN